jgi:hypothetical protein
LRDRYLPRRLHERLSDQQYDIILWPKVRYRQRTIYLRDSAATELHGILFLTSLDPAKKRPLAPCTNREDGKVDLTNRDPVPDPLRISRTQPNDISDTFHDDDLEDGFARRKRRKRAKKNWWNIMGVRLRKQSLEEEEAYKAELSEALLAGTYRNTRTRRKRRWYNYCIFGGISGLSILFVLFAPL